MKYIKGIDTLRFFAAMLVLIFHCNDGLRQLDATLFYSFPILSKGTAAVDYFFILSGFLITLLAFWEIKKKGTFNTKKFFIRRVFRIFPLYYLAVFLGFFSIGYLYPLIFGSNFFDFEVKEGLFYYLFFLPNYVIVNWKQIGPTYSLWSIGVEEQFYVIFPLLIFFLRKSEKKLLFLLSIFSLYLLFYLSVFNENLVFNSPWGDLIIKTLRLHFILLGAVLGYAFFTNKNNAFFIFLGKRFVQILIWALFLFFIFFLPNHYDPTNIGSAILFSIILINTSRDVSIIGLKNPYLCYLGTISYGIYVFHPFVSLAIRLILLKLVVAKDIIIAWPFLFYILVTTITIIIASLSFKYYESYFIKQKKRFY